MKRRDFINKTAKGTLTLSLLGATVACKNAEKKIPVISNSKELQDKLFFKISLAQWSLHRTLRSGSIDHLDFAAKASSLGCEGLEYVSSFFQDKAKNTKYLSQMNNRASSEGVQNVLIMIDGEGNLADDDTTKRIQDIENHYKWIEAAKYLGCNAIRVNLAGGIDRAEASKAGINSLLELAAYGEKEQIHILVENHGGFSSDGLWLSDVMKKANHDYCGTLPDFGNFCIEKGTDGHCKNEYDRYLGVQQLMPYAKAVSAKSHDFNEAGEEIHTDFTAMLKMVKASNYTGFVGIEYEGDTLSEEEGIIKTRDLLIKVGRTLS